MTPTPDSPAPKSQGGDAKMPPAGITWPNPPGTTGTTGPEKGPIPAPGQAPTVGSEAREAAGRYYERAPMTRAEHALIVQEAIDSATRAAEERCKALEAELARLNALSTSQGHTIQAQAEEIVGLLKDKARLDWLEKSREQITCWDSPGDNSTTNGWTIGDILEGKEVQGDTCRSVIDAALAAQDGKGEG